MSRAYGIWRRIVKVWKIDVGEYWSTCEGFEIYSVYNGALVRDPKHNVNDLIHTKALRTISDRQ
jgi:hypothetical protein